MLRFEVSCPMQDIGSLRSQVSVLLTAHIDGTGLVEDDVLLWLLLNSITCCV
jgi:hypothetical protein